MGMDFTVVAGMPTGYSDELRVLRYWASEFLPHELESENLIQPEPHRSTAQQFALEYGYGFAPHSVAADGTVTFRPKLMEVERPYPFRVGDGWLVAVRRGEEDVAIYDLVE